MWLQREGTGKDEMNSMIHVNTHIHVVPLRAENCNLPDTIKNSTILLMLNVRDKHINCKEP